MIAWSRTSRSNQPSPKPLSAYTAAGRPLLHGISLDTLIGDNAFDSDWLRTELNERDSLAVIPPNGSRAGTIPYGTKTHKWRHLVENALQKIKEFRRIATRYDKTDTSFRAAIHLVASFLALKRMSHALVDGRAKPVEQEVWRTGVVARRDTSAKADGEGVGGAKIEDGFGLPSVVRRHPQADLGDVGDLGCHEHRAQRREGPSVSGVLAQRNVEHGVFRRDCRNYEARLTAGCEAQPQAVVRRLEMNFVKADKRPAVNLDGADEERTAVRVVGQLRRRQRFDAPVAVGGVEDEKLDRRRDGFAEQLQEVQVGFHPFAMFAAADANRRPAWSPVAGEGVTDELPAIAVMEDDAARRKAKCGIGGKIAAAKIRGGAVAIEAGCVGWVLGGDGKGGDATARQHHRDVVLLGASSRPRRVG